MCFYNPLDGLVAYAYKLQTTVDWEIFIVKIFLLLPMTKTKNK